MANNSSDVQTLVYRSEYGSVAETGREWFTRNAQSGVLEPKRMFRAQCAATGEQLECFTRGLAEWWLTARGSVRQGEVTTTDGEG